MPKSIRTQRHRALVAALIAARKDAGLTQRELAARLKVSQSFVRDVESRYRRIDVVELMDICEALELRLEEFLRRLATR